MAHIQRMGDVGCKLGEWLGVKGSRQWVEGFGMAPANGIALEDIEYQAVLGRNWLSPWVEGGKFCGSRGMALPLLGLKVRLKGAAAKAFECSYSATFVDGSAVGPVNGGETCEAESLAATGGVPDRYSAARRQDGRERPRTATTAMPAGRLRAGPVPASKSPHRAVNAGDPQATAIGGSCPRSSPHRASTPAISRHPA